MALSNLAHQAQELGRVEEAVDFAREAVQILTPYYLERPAQFRDSLAFALGRYMTASEEAGVQVDMGLLETFVAHEVMDAESSDNR
jgi:hypothetical protein